MIPGMAATSRLRAILAGLATLTGLLSCCPTAALATKPARLSPAQQTDALGFDLMRKLPPGNLVFSPDSIAAALGMVGEGAASTTASQIAHVLHLQSPAGFGALGRLQKTILAEQATASRGGKPIKLDIANALFLQDSFPVESPFLDVLRQSFAASPQRVDFQRSPKAAVQTINHWVDEHTDGAIPSILESVSPAARLVLVNAIHLKAAWAEPFEVERTRPGAFHAASGRQQVSFMHQTNLFGYAAGTGYSAVDLPYDSSTLSMLVVLPEQETLAALQRRMSPGMLTRIVRGLSLKEVTLSLPKFKVAVRDVLNEPLQALGMTDAFSSRADFARIAPGSSLQIGKALHAADIEVDERGTVASAVTTVEFKPLGRSSRPPATFDADRPFMFLLLDDRTGTVLFAGRLVDAASAQG
jgi:serpin B